MEAVAEWLDGIRRKVEDYHFEYEGQELKISITIGVAAGRPEDSLEDWVNRADMRLYEGKKTGKNKVVA